MLFLELPLVLVQDIIAEVVRSSELMQAVELRLVNKFFDAQVTRSFAQHRLLGLTDNTTDHMSRAMSLSTKLRLMNYFVNHKDNSKFECVRHIQDVARYLESVAPVHEALLGEASCALDWITSVISALERYQNFTYTLLRMVRKEVQRPARSGHIASHHNDMEATSYSIAIMLHRRDIQTAMLQNGYSIMIWTDWFQSPLDDVCCTGDAWAVKQLLDHRYESARNIWYNYPLCLYHAAAKEDVEMLQLLLTHPEGPRTRYFGGPYETMLQHLVDSMANEGRFAILEVLLGEVPDYDYRGLCSFAAKFGRNDLVQKCLDRGVDITAGKITVVLRWGSIHTVASEYFPLIEAIDGAHISTVALLLDHGASTDFDKHADTIGHAIARGGNIGILHMLLSRGLILSNRDAIFAIAAERGHLNMLDFALEDQHHLSHRRTSQLSKHALLAAINQGQVQTTQLLLDRLELNIEDRADLEHNFAMDPLVTAIDTGSPELVKILQQHETCVTKPEILDLDFSFKGRAARGRSICNAKDKLGLSVQRGNTLEYYIAPQWRVNMALEAAKQGSEDMSFRNEQTLSL